MTERACRIRKRIHPAAEHADHRAVRTLVVFFKGLRELRKITNAVADLEIIENLYIDFFLAALAVLTFDANGIFRAGLASPDL